VESTESKLDRLREILRGLGRVAVAFSGGVDSTFVLKVAADTLGRENVLAVMGDSPSMPEADARQAQELAEMIGVELVRIDPGEFNDPAYLANPTNRCYFCKNALFDRMRPLLDERGLLAIVCGTNADDLGDYRPGLTAAKEHAVQEPCAEAGLTKADIRALSREMGLPTAEKPASPCLASRVPYGEAVTPAKLRMIERAERFLREQMRIVECRVRCHEQPRPTAACGGVGRLPTADDTSQASRGGAGPTADDRPPPMLARIEVPAESIAMLAMPGLRDQVCAAFRQIGFQYVTLDLRGFRSGSLNEVIASAHEPD